MDGERLYAHGDATALGAAFRRGELDPSAAMRACLARMERLDPFVAACTDRAAQGELLAAAESAAARWRTGRERSPLDGVPFGVKVNIAVCGMAWHAGIAAYRERVAERDAACVARLRDAGMIPVAVLNMHEAALGETSDNPAFRTTRNPHAPQRIPGGSSGGSAAAVAAGMLPLALGTDDLGSVRLPSAFCGVVGFKPGRGGVPTDGVIPLSPELDHVGVHARSVRDVVAVHAILATEAPRASADAPRPARWRLPAVEGADAAVAAAFEDALRGCDAATVDWSDVDLAALRRAGLLICERDAAQHFASALKDRPDGFSEGFRKLVAWGAAQTAPKVARARQRLAEAAERLRNDVRDQLLLCPTTPHVAPRRDAAIPTSLADWTAPAAIAGLPAVSVPTAPRLGGLPTGLQIVGRSSADVLRFAADFHPGIAALPAHLVAGPAPANGGSP